jgi:hypothetical protein
MRSVTGFVTLSLTFNKLLPCTNVSIGVTNPDRLSGTAPSPLREKVGVRGYKQLILFSPAIAPALLYLLHPCSRLPNPLQLEREQAKSGMLFSQFCNKLIDKHMHVRGDFLDAAA